MTSNGPGRLLATLLLCLVAATAGSGPLVLNEICAVGSTLRDEAGDDSDWVEIYNRSAEAVALGGWSLTDNLRQPRKWVFPDQVIPAGGYLIVFASGKDRRAAGRPLHANFQLSRGGEYLALLDPRVEVVSEIGLRYPEQQHDYSYGLRPGDGDGTDHYQYLAPPTPGADNAGSTAVHHTILGEVRARPERGFYSAPIEVSLVAPAPGSEVYFTLDGSVPQPRPEQRYRRPLRISESRVVRARAFKPDHVPSPTMTQTFLVGLTGPQTLLPVISLATDDANLHGPTGIIGISDRTRVAAPGEDLYPGGDEQELGPRGYFNPPNRGRDWERPVSMELINPDGHEGFQIDAGFRIAASNNTRSHSHLNTKFSYRLYFRTDHGPRKLAHPLIPGAGSQRFKRLVLRAGLDDPFNPFIRDELLRRLWADMGHPSARGTFVHLFLNGQYKGYYNPTEYIDESTLNEWSHQPARRWDIVKQRGEFLAGDRTAWDATVALTPPGLPPPVDRFAAVASRVDMESLCDYWLLNFYAATWDWPDNNWAAVRPLPGGKFTFLVWDAEGAFGFDTDTSRDPIASEMHYVRSEGDDFPQLYRGLLASHDTYQFTAADTRWRYAKGVDAELHGADAWLARDFDDSGWAEGQAPIGYGDGDERTVLEGMFGKQVTVSIRHRFKVSGPRQLQQLMLYVQYDDAFVAYLNGIEVARSEGLPGLVDAPVGAQDFSTIDHEARGRHEPFDISAHLGGLVEGDNVLCVRAHNASRDSSDLKLYPVLVGYRFSREHPFRSLFSERVERHLFGAGALTERNLRRRFDALKQILSPVIPEFDAGSQSRRSIGSDWIPNRRGPFLELLRRHGLWFGGAATAEPATPAPSADRRP